MDLVGHQLNIMQTVTKKNNKKKIKYMMTNFTDERKINVIIKKRNCIVSYKYKL